jgi:hypothetical protein
VLFFASEKIEFLIRGTDSWIVWKTTFFASGKIEFLVRGTDFGGGKKKLTSPSGDELFHICGKN